MGNIFVKSPSQGRVLNNEYTSQKKVIVPRCLLYNVFLYDVLIAGEVKYLNPNPVPVTKLILCMSAIFFLCLAAVILNLQYGLPLRVRFKDSFGIVEENDGKANDVLILYSSKDSEIALGVLMPTLQTKFNYKCVSREFPLNLNYCKRDSFPGSENITKFGINFRVRRTAR